MTAANSISLITPARVAALAMLLTAILAVSNLGGRSLWLDEAYTVEIAGGSWSHLWERVTTKEPSMAFYYVLMHGWLALGRDEATIRAFSALVAVAAIPLAYLVGVRLVGANGAAIGVLLLSLNAFFLRYAQEARAYTLIIFVALASSLALLRAIERPAIGRWAVWVVCGALLVYSHPLAILVVGAQAAGALPRAPFRMLATAGAAIGVLVSPIVWFMFARDTGQLAWVPPPDRYAIELAVARLIGIEGRLGILAYAVCGLLALWRGGFGARFLLAWAALPFLAIVVVSFAKPLFIDRYFLMIVPAIVLLAGAGLARVPGPWLRGLAVAGLLALQAIGIPGMLAAPSGEDWRGTAAIVRANQQPDDAAACWYWFTCVSFDYYFAPPPGGPRIVPIADAVGDPAAFAAIVAAHPRLWLAVSHAHLEDRAAMLARIEAMLGTSYVLAAGHDLSGVSLRRYDRRPDDGSGTYRREGVFR